MRKYHTVIFDLDGTLLDSKNGFWHCFETALMRLGYPNPHIDVIEPFIGPPLEDLLVDTFGFSREESKRGRAYYLEEYKDNGVMFTDPFFPGTAEAVARLKAAGIRVGVCTNKGHDCAEPIVLKGNIGLDSEDVVGYMPEPEFGRTCKVDIINTYLKRFDIYDEALKKGVLMVGDRATDISGARDAGIDGAGVTWGNGSLDELKSENPVCIADTYEELLNFIGE